jgi:hypothetical protein
MGVPQNGMQQISFLTSLLGCNSIHNAHDAKGTSSRAGKLFSA